MRVARVVLATGIAIACAGFCTREARAGGTNGTGAEGIKLYHAGHYEEAVSSASTKCWSATARSRDPDQAGRMLPEAGQAREGDRRLRLRQPAPILGLASFGQNAIYNPNSTSLSTLLTLGMPDLNFAESWGNRGIALLMLDRNEEALASFKTAVSLWNIPQNRGYTAGRAAAYQGLGQSYHRLGEDPDRTPGL